MTSVPRDKLTNASKPLQLYISLHVGSHCAYSASPPHDASPWSGSLQTITTHWSVHWAVSSLEAHPGSVLQLAQGEFAAYGPADSKVIISKSQRKSEDRSVIREGEVDDRTGPHLQLCNQISIYTLIFKLHSLEFYISHIVLSSKEFRLVVWGKEIQTSPLATPPSNRDCTSNIKSGNPAFPG